MKQPEPPGTDRRVRKTLGLLHEALFSLIREKDYDAIVIKEILNRANVGRSTFYTHFRDKDELLESGIRDTLRQALATAGRQERLLGFTLPVFEQIHAHRHAGETHMGARARAIVHGHLQAALTDVIAGDLQKHLATARGKTGGMPADLLVHYVASTFTLVLNWWMEAANPLPPVEANALFHALVQPVLANRVAAGGLSG